MLYSLNSEKSFGEHALIRPPVQVNRIIIIFLNVFYQQQMVYYTILHSEVL